MSCPKPYEEVTVRVTVRADYDEMDRRRNFMICPNPCEEVTVGAEYAETDRRRNFMICPNPWDEVTLGAYCGDLYAYEAQRERRLEFLKALVYQHDTVMLRHQDEQERSFYIYHRNVEDPSKIQLTSFTHNIPTVHSLHDDRESLIERLYACRLGVVVHIM